MKKTKRLLQAQSLNHEAITLLNSGRLSQSIDLFMKSLKIYKKLKNERSIALSYINLALAYRANCQYDDALKILSRVKNWATRQNNQVLLRKTNNQIRYTIHAKEKSPIVQIASPQLSRNAGVKQGLADFIHLPKAFNEITATIENINIEIKNGFEARIAITFVISDAIESNRIYEVDQWKQDRINFFRSRLTNLSPNLAVFLGKHVTLQSSSIRIHNEENMVVKFDVFENSWHIFIPKSYPLGGFAHPVPVCERYMFFDGFAKLILWDLGNEKYTIELTLNKDSKQEPFQFALFFPFEKQKISVMGLEISRNCESMFKSYLKLIPFECKRKILDSKGKFYLVPRHLDFTNIQEIFTFKGQHIENASPAQTIEVDDYATVGIELFPILTKLISKIDLFPTLKKDIDFRKDLGEEKYSKLIQAAQNLPEKCKPNTSTDDCKTCSSKKEPLCIVKLLGVICGSDIMPHHGFEYSDLLLKAQIEQETIPIPVLIKGPQKLTWKNDNNLFKQLLEKLQDTKVKIILIVVSGQIGNDLMTHIENSAALYSKVVIFLDSRDIAQLLHYFLSAT